jgi:hypothetical protein
MILPTDFQFSQASLQDYLDCPRRFHLRYVRRLRWPAIETEPCLENERHLRLGVALHQLIRQHVTGVPAKKLERMATGLELRRWWQDYLSSELADLPWRRYAEVRLATRVGAHRLGAQYDVIAIGPERDVLIVDWKTNRKRPRRAWLAERLQTHVYPYVLVRGGDALDSGTAIEPERVTMVYWFANYASAPERFVYGRRQYREDETCLLGLMEEVEERLGACAPGALLPPADDRGRCRICRYRSLCERGVEAGWLNDAEQGLGTDESFDFSLDFEQIAELEVA